MGLFSGGTSTYGSDSSSFSGLDKGALPRWKNLFAGYQQGIAPWQQAGFDQAISSAMSHFSGLDAAKGGLTPYSLPQIASSAAQYVAPQFALANSQALDSLMNLRNIATSTSHSFGLQQGPNLFGSALAQGLGQNFSAPAWMHGAGGGQGIKAMF